MSGGVVAHWLSRRHDAEAQNRWRAAGVILVPLDDRMLRLDVERRNLSLYADNAGVGEVFAQPKVKA
jgi:hypothetical protein